MKEFMTRVSDYLSERRNDPENNVDLVAFGLAGVAILVIIVLCLLLIWRKNSNEKNEELKAETFVETMEVVPADYLDEEEFRMQYLTSTEYLNEKVDELLSSLTEVRETLTETIKVEENDDSELRAEDEKLREQIAALQEEINALKEEDIRLNEGNVA